MWQLKIGNKLTDITVQPDPRWPGMWRVHGPKGVSDMVNLTRAKDAAIVWARPPDQGGIKDASWEYRASPTGKRPVA